MEIYSAQVIDFAIDKVYPLVRDNLNDLVPYLQNVKRIETEAKEDLGEGRIRLINRWHGKGEIPKVVQSIVKPEMITWLDTAVWNDEDKSCHWEIQTMFFKDNIRCKGINYYKPQGQDRTKLEITGDLTIHLKGIPGVPRLLEKKISSQVEKFIVKLLTPNMSSLAQGVNQYLSKIKG
jgi:hypothetical protein